MSNIDPNIIDPRVPNAPPPGEIDPSDDELVEPDNIREPDTDRPAIEPDPEEGGTGIPVRRA